jgi:hypothetical protein
MAEHLDMVKVSPWGKSIAWDPRTRQKKSQVQTNAEIFIMKSKKSEAIDPRSETYLFGK